MAEGQEPQGISLSALMRVLSEPRLQAYRLDAAESPEVMVGRYRWNIALSMSLYPAIQQVEVALRNNLHRAASSLLGTDSWYDSIPQILTQREQDAILAAKVELSKQRKPADPDRLVAELTLGFWTSLLSRDYERHFWPRMLSSTFPFMPRRLRTRATVAGRFQEIRRLRNRISHQEPVFKMGLAQLDADIREAISWMAPTLLKLMPVGESFTDIYSKGPGAYQLPTV